MQFCRVSSHPVRGMVHLGRKDFLSRSLVTEVFTTEVPFLDLLIRRRIIAAFSNFQTPPMVPVCTSALPSKRCAFFSIVCASSSGAASHIADAIQCSLGQT